MDILSLLVGCIVILSLIFFLMRPKRNSLMPPGPRGLPFIGNMLSLAKHPAKYLTDVSKKYGSIFTIHIGPKPIIVLCDYKDMKELLKKKETAGRPKSGIFYQISKGKGLILSTGDLWVASRKLVLRYFKESGKTRMEKAVMTEMKNITSFLDNYCESNEKINMAHLLMKSASNVICILCFGKMYSYDDPEFKKGIERIEENFKLFLKVQSLSVFKPWVSFLLQPLENKILDNAIHFRKMTQQVIDEHIENFNTHKDTESDFIYDYLSLAENEKTKSEKNDYSIKQLLEITVDVFAAGTETLAATLRWMILFLLNEPEELKKVQEEIDSVVGRSRMPTLEDKEKLPLTVACFQEAERMASIAHLGVIHTCIEDFIYKDHVFPQGTDIMYNIMGVHFNSDLFEEPTKFNPARFLDQSGNVFRPEALIPFGTGRRICAGEMLAKIELFLYTATLLHRYNFHKVDGEPDSKSPPGAGLSRVPQGYKIRLSRRK